MIYQWINGIFGIDASSFIGFEGLVVALLVFLVSVACLKVIIPILRKHKVGQPIHEALENHAVKAGTPTMGGVGFIIALLAVLLLWVILDVCGVIGMRDNSGLVVFAYILLLGVLNSLVGVVDDIAKLKRKQNAGLRPWQKLVLQFTFAIAFVAAMATSGNLTTVITFPFSNYVLDLDIFAYPFYVLVIVGFINSTNITDGLDGLASSVGVSVTGTILLLSCFTEYRYMGVISGALLGALLGFLVFNHYPAKVFMGDTGSLFIGGIIVGCALYSGHLISVMIMGMVFILDLISSAMQTLWYKLTKKRIFKRAPVHHHFEMLGWKETKIVTVFFIVSVIFCAIGLMGIMLF